MIYYSTSIFGPDGAGLSDQNAQYATLATGAVNVCMTFVSALIMDRVGRRTLHLTGLGGMFISSYLLAVGLIFQVIIAFWVIFYDFFFCRLLIFFETYFFEKFYLDFYQGVKRFGFRSGPTICQA